MKLFVALTITVVIFSGCTQQQATSNSTSTPAAASSPAAPTASQSSVAQNGSPVEFSSSGISADKTNVAYKIKVNTDKPIEEVHMALKETDAKGKVVTDTTLIWQNIVGSTRHPIESGKTYDDTAILDPAAVKADLSLKEVVFKDGSRWTTR